MEKSEKSILNTILNINYYLLNHNLYLIEDAFNLIKNDITKLNFNENIIQGLWRYYLLTEYKDLNYKSYKKKIKIAVDGKNEEWEINRQKKWEKYDYFVCILKIGRWIYQPIVKELFNKWINNLLQTNKTREYWNYKLINLEKLADFGNKIISELRNLKPNRLLSEIGKIGIKLKKENDTIKREIEDYKQILKNYKTASQKYSNNMFNDYEELYKNNGLNYKVAFGLLSKKYPELIKSNYNTFHTAYKKRRP